MMRPDVPDGRGVYGVSCGSAAVTMLQQWVLREMLRFCREMLRRLQAERRKHAVSAETCGVLTGDYRGMNRNKQYDSCSKVLKTASGTLGEVRRCSLPTLAKQFELWLY